MFDGRDGLTPILRGTVEPVQLARLGLDSGTVGEDLTIALSGRSVAQILRPERTIDVRLRYPDDIRYDAERLARTPIAYGPQSLPLVVGDHVRASAGAGRAASRWPTPGARDDGGDEVRRPRRRRGRGARALAGVPLPRGAVLEIGGQAARPAMRDAS